MLSDLYKTQKLNLQVIDFWIKNQSGSETWNGLSGFKLQLHYRNQIFPLLLKIVSYALRQIPFWLDTHSHLSRFCQVKISDSKETLILQLFCSEHLVFWFLGKFAFLQHEWVLPSTEMISSNNNNWAITQEECLNMDGFFSPCFTKRNNNNSFMETKKPSQLCNFNFVILLEVSRKQNLNIII